MELPMKKKPKHDYPLLSLRIPSETQKKRAELDRLGIDVPSLLKQKIDQILEDALNSAKKQIA